MSTATESSFIQGARAWIWDELLNRASTGVQQSVTFTFTSTPFVNVSQQKLLIIQYIIPQLEQRGYRCRLFSVQHAAYIDLNISQTEFNIQDRSEDTIDDVSKNPFVSSSEDEDEDDDEMVSSDDEDLDDDLEGEDNEEEEEETRNEAEATSLSASAITTSPDSRWVGHLPLPESLPQCTYCLCQVDVAPDAGSS